MQMAIFKVISGARLVTVGAFALVLATGVLLGTFISFATGVEHSLASKPIKVDYCFLFSHEDLFRGQQVETSAHYILGMDGAGIGKDECPDYEAVFAGPPDDDPIGKDWDKDIKRQWYPAEFDISFIGIIPSRPRYMNWYSEAKNHWHPTHHIPSIRILRLTHFQRTR